MYYWSFFILDRASSYGKSSSHRHHLDYWNCFPLRWRHAFLIAWIGWNCLCVWLSEFHSFCHPRYPVKSSRVCLVRPAKRKYPSQQHRLLLGRSAIATMFCTNYCIFSACFCFVAVVASSKGHPQLTTVRCDRPHGYWWTLLGSRSLSFITRTYYTVRLARKKWEFFLRCK